MRQEEKACVGLYDKITHYYSKVSLIFGALSSLLLLGDLRGLKIVMFSFKQNIMGYRSDSYFKFWMGGCL